MGFGERASGCGEVLESGGGEGFQGGGDEGFGVGVVVCGDELGSGDVVDGFIVCAAVGDHGGLFGGGHFGWWVGGGFEVVGVG